MLSPLHAEWSCSCKMIGKGGQMVSVSLTGVLAEQRSRRFRRRGESKTTHRHFRDTRTSATHLSCPKIHSNQIFPGGHRRGVRRLSHDLSYLTGRQLLQGAAHKTYVDVTCIKSPWSRDGHNVFPLASLRNGNLSESMTQRDKEMMAKQWRGMLGRLDDRDHLN
jgi:hypothetical protein